MKLKLTTLLVTILCISISVPSFAQATQGKVVSKVVDIDNGLPVVGAVLEIVSKADPSKKTYQSTNPSGDFTIPQLQYGDYSINISFFGYDKKEIPFTLKKELLELPHIELSIASNEIQAVVATAKAIRASQKGDTLAYNASAFKVSADADVEGLLQKMPGIAIEDGEVSAQGETITKIYVDGREFFGDDVATALKSLPAEMVDKIEVFDKLSDNAEATGVDDGEGQKTINIVTRKSMRKGAFGKVFGGLGYEPDAMEGTDANKYLLGGNINLFNEASRISIIGVHNNINQQNFSFEDILGVSEESESQSNAGSYMVKQLPGVATVSAVGVNYSDSFGEKEKLKVQGSFFYNKTYTINILTKDMWYEEPAQVDTLHTVSTNTTENLNYRLNGRVDWKISKRSSVMIRPSFSYQKNLPYNTTEGERWGESVLEGQPYRSQYGLWDGNWSGYNLNIYGNYRLSLNDKGRVIVLNGSVARNSYDNIASYISSSYTNSGTSDDPEYVNDVYYRHKDAPSNYQAYNAGLNYVEPLGKGFSLSLNLDYNTNNQDNRTTTYDTDEYYNYTDDDINIYSTSYTESSYTRKKMGAGIKYWKGKTNFSLNATYQLSNLATYVDKYSGEDSTDSDFEDLTYYAVANVQINKENSIKFYASSYTSNPPIWRMQDIVNTEQYMSKGNPLLMPTYTNQLKIRYTRSNLVQGRTFMAMLHGRTTSDYVANHIKYFSDDESMVIGTGDDATTYTPLQYTVPVNMDGYWYVFSKISYGMPASFIKCNFNFNASVKYTNTPSMIGGEVDAESGLIIGGDESSTSNIEYKTGVVLSSNISENVDFTLSWRGTYNEATNTVAGENELNRYFNHVASASMKFVFLDGFTLTGSAAYTQYMGFTNEYDDSYVLCNVFLGRKVFKNR
ncbi:MAG: outer membrane beta-barrel protein, partial [Rikenellaceae bacterium]